MTLRKHYFFANILLSFPCVHLLQNEGKGLRVRVWLKMSGPIAGSGEKMLEKSKTFLGGTGGYIPLNSRSL